MLRIPRVLTLTPVGRLDVRAVVAGGRSGGLGILDLTGLRSEDDPEPTRGLVARTSRLLKDRSFGARVPTLEVGRAILAPLPENLTVLVIPLTATKALPGLVSWAREHRRFVLAEIADEPGADAAERLGLDGLLIVGEEAGGFVGRSTSLVLLQAVLNRQTRRLPVWVRGGVGLQNAAGWIAAGATGVALDGALSLSRESCLPTEIKEAVRTWDGTESSVQDLGEGRRYRAFVPRALANPESQAISATDCWEPGQPWPLGQDSAFAADLARRYVTVGGIVQAVNAAIDEGLAAAERLAPLAEGSPLAQSHRTRYPIVQGPMTRVSDRAGFASAVAIGGALPLLALAMMREPEVKQALAETAEAMAGRPWGVGLLGFLPAALRGEQIREVLDTRPPYALIAGGRPDQAKELEQAGIRTYLHAPSPRLLDQFVREGARRFVLEGSECGGHVGPRTSAVLWEQAVGVLLDRIRQGIDPTELHVLFAGGIHDARSAAFVAATSAPLAAQGVKVGVLMGTAYLFTEEAVKSGAIVEGFQREAIGCRSTVLLETGPGHVVRVSATPFAEDFSKERARLSQEGLGSEAIREALEGLNVGRLRIAAKGMDRANGQGSPLLAVDPDSQRSRGLYMLGEVASLRDQVTTIAALHHEVCIEGTERLRTLPRTRPPRNRRSMPSNIAVVGMAAVVPGATGARAFWENTLKGVDAITEVPEDRWDWRTYFDADPKAPDKITSKWGGFLPEIPFDPVRFGMPPSSVASIEPLQLITLEVVRAALEDAGYTDRPFPRERTAVVIGAGGGAAQLAMGYAFRSYLPMLDTVLPGAGSEALARCRSLLPEWTEDSFPGILLNVAAGRVANRFDLGGANYTVDAACGSSLAAAAAAIRELESRSADMVLLGGADTVQNPFTYLAFSKTQAFSARGRCRPFDAGADGIVISEAVAVLVLKRLTDAERDGDRIYSVIKGLGSSSDGKAKGLTAPRREGQVRALRRAYEKAGICPSTVGYVEAHGTGTAVGDVAEISALSDVFVEAGAPTGHCALGSVKSLIGHTKCAAGLVGLINASLAIYHGVLPPTIGVETPNPKAGVSGGPFHLSTRARPWSRSRPDLPRRAGVSAFGFGGTNFHAVLEAHEGEITPPPPPVLDWPVELFAWKATSPEALTSDLEQLINALEHDSIVPLRDLARALAINTFGATRRDGEPEWRLAIVASSTRDLLGKLKGVLPRLAHGLNMYLDPSGVSLEGGPARAPGKLAFLFPGQGSQYPGMLEELAVHFPEVASSFEETDRTLAASGRGVVGPLVFAPPSWSDVEAKEQARRLAAPEVAQPALGAASVGLFAILQRLGLRPDLLGGHSYGEIVALQAAGVFSKERLTTLSEFRGRLLRDAAGAEPGAMAAINGGYEQVLAILGNTPGVVIANHNGPSQTVISGTTQGVRSVVEVARSRGISARVIPVACAFHSPLVASAGPPLSAAVAESRARPPRIPVYSNLTTAPYTDDPGRIAEQVGEHLASQVRFSDMVTAMHDAGARLFVEVGPSGVLTSLVGSILQEREHLAIALDAPGRRGVSGLLGALGRLYTAGVAVDLRHLTSERSPSPLQWNQGAFFRAVEAHSATTWLANGTRARPAIGPEPPRFGPGRPLPVSPRAPLAPLPIADFAGSPEVPSDPVLSAFQQNMRAFLDVQRSTMLSFLAASPAKVEIPEQPGGARLAKTNGRAAHSPPLATLNETEGQVQRKLLAIVQARTGYPTEMLGPEMDMEADLGIDSIKRVEILGSLRDAFPDRFHASESEILERLTKARTLGEIVEQLDRGSQKREVESENQHAIITLPEPLMPASPTEARRMGIVVVDSPMREGSEPLSLKGRVVVLTDDGQGLSNELAERLKILGARPFPVRHAPGAFRLATDGTLELDLTRESDVERLAAEVRALGPVAGLLRLPRVKDRAEREGLSGWTEGAVPELRGLFLLARAFAPDLIDAAGQGGGSFIAATSLGGAFASGGSSISAFSPGEGGVAGLVKSVARELSNVRVCVVDMDLDQSNDQLASWLIDELRSDDPRIEVGYRRGVRIALEAEDRPLSPRASGFQIGEGEPILFTGGARGITAKVAEDFARRWRPTILLLGSTEMPEAPEPESLAQLSTPSAIKEYLFENLRSRGSLPSPMVLERAYQGVVRAREVRMTIGRLEALGSTVEYAQGDIRDASRLKATLARWKETHGPIAGFVHGAGRIEDKPLRDKSLDSFDRVLGVKLEGAWNLAKLVDPVGLRFAAFFSSVAGRFGNAGQSDYAAANEGLNKLALWLDRRWDCRVVSMIWGPWSGSGMAETIGDRFARRGIGMIDPVDGASRLADELLRGEKGEVEVIVSGPLGDLSDTIARRTRR